MLFRSGSVDGDRRAFAGAGISRMNVTRVAAEIGAAAPFAQLWSEARPLLSMAGDVSLHFGRVRVLAPAA